MGERILVIGGTRSGKSRVAEALLAGAPGVTYVATGTASDAEMAARVAAHRARRPASWVTVETDDCAAAIRAANPRHGVLVDSLGAWLTRRMDAHRLWPRSDQPVAPLGEGGIAALLADVDACAAAAAEHPGGPVVVVAEDAGAGLVPPDAATRRWVDLYGVVLQHLAAAADRVLHVIAGRASELPPAPVAPVDPPLELRHHGDRMQVPGALDFAVNVHGQAPPDHVAKAIEAALDVAAYPDDRAARSAIAERHRRPVADILVTAGAAEAFWLLPRVVRVRLAVVVHPSFTEPEAALRAAGVPITHLLRDPAADWRFDPDAVPPDADLAVVGNPNNPTGSLDHPEVLAALCRPGRVTLVDEAFMDFVPEDEASLAGRRDLPGLVVVRSATKLWGLAGVRAGYLLAPPGLVQRLVAARQPWPVGNAALAALIACMQDRSWREETARQVAAARRELAAALRLLPHVTVWEGAANFLLLRVPAGPRVVAKLLDRGITVRPSTFPGLHPDHLRVTVRSRDANRRFVAALADVLAAERR